MSLVLIPHPDIILQLRKIQGEFIRKINKTFHKSIVFPTFPLWLALEDFSRPDSKANSDSTSDLQKLKQVRSCISEVIIEKIEVENEAICFSCSYFSGKTKFSGKIQFAFYYRGAFCETEKENQPFFTVPEAEKNSSAVINALKAAQNAASSQLPLKIKIFELGFADFKIPETKKAALKSCSWQTEKTVWVKKK